MFGGYGLYREVQMFAIVIDDTLYLKTDTTRRREKAARLGTGPRSRRVVRR
jgi:TfoX/Sxy family transcriptional regulator of competence genes